MITENDEASARGSMILKSDLGGRKEMNKKIYLLLGIASLMLLCGCGNTNAAVTYKLVETHPVGGRQGICTEGGNYWVSGSGKLE